MWKGSSGSKSWTFHRLVAASVGGACHRLPRWPRIKNPPANAGDVRDSGSIPGSGRFPGEGNGNPF